MRHFHLAVRRVTSICLCSVLPEAVACLRCNSAEPRELLAVTTKRKRAKLRLTSEKEMFTQS